MLDGGGGKGGGTISTQQLDILGNCQRKLNFGFYAHRNKGPRTIPNFDTTQMEVLSIVAGTWTLLPFL